MLSLAVSDAESWRLTAPADDLIVSVGSLRQWQSTDAPALVAAWRDSEIARWNDVPENPSEEDARRWIGGWASRLAGGHALDLVVATQHSVAGEIGISGINAQRRAGLVGYWTSPAFRGQGIASDALTTVASWALGQGGFALLVARCHPANVASQRTAARAGFEYQMTEPDGPQLWARRA